MKIKDIIIIWLIAFILASCIPAPTIILPTKTLSPSATSTYPAPSATLSPTEIPATPTETPFPPIVAPPGFEALTGNEHYGPQFEAGGDPNRYWVTCFMDAQSFRLTDFWIGDMQIRSVFDCYFQNDKKEVQRITLPYSMWNERLQTFYMYGSMLQGKADLDFGEGYMDGMSKSFANLAERGFHLCQFNINNFNESLGSERTDFLKPTADLLAQISEDFNIHGTAKFADQPGAPNFVFPSQMNWQY